MVPSSPAGAEDRGGADGEDGEDHRRLHAASDEAGGRHRRTGLLRTGQSSADARHGETICNIFLFPTIRYYHDTILSRYLSHDTILSRYLSHHTLLSRYYISIAITYIVIYYLFSTADSAVCQHLFYVIRHSFHSGTTTKPLMLPFI